jgi:hypothetical protein
MAVHAYTYLDTKDKLAFAKLLAQAAAHARRVSVREHIKADRFERVSQFIVSLRRQLTTLGNGLNTTRSRELVNKYCDKSKWHDIEVPAEADSLLQECLLLATRERDSLGVLTQDIELGLDLAAAELKGAQLLVEEMDRINGRSEVVLTSLGELF